MATLETHDYRNSLPPTTEPRSTVTTTSTDGTAARADTSMQVAAGGTTGEALAGLAVIVLAIIGLATTGNLPFYMAGICALVAGGALVLLGMSMAARLMSALEGSGGAGVGGLSAEFCGGVAAVILGILALIGLYPMTLVAVAALVSGAVLLLGCCATAGSSSFSSGRWSGMSESNRVVVQEATNAAAGLQALIGIAVVILGIIALASNLHTLSLTLVAFLILGVGIMASGSALSAKMMTQLFHRR